MSDHDRRSYDAQIAELQTTLNDLVKRFEPMERFYQRMYFPMTALGWTITVTVAAILGAIGMAIWEWLKGHWH